MKKNKNGYNVQLLSIDGQIDLYEFVEFISEIDFKKYDVPTVLDYSKYSTDFNFRIAMIEHNLKTVYLETCFDEPYIKLA